MNTKRLQLLIVEDEAAHVEAIRRAYEDAGIDAEIHSVGTLRDFREFVKTRQPDLALIDLNLPDGLATEVLTHPPEDAPFPILVMTAFGNQQIVVEVMKAGALDYVVKSSVAFTEMPHSVEHALREWELLQKHKRAEEELSNSEIRMRAITDSAHDAVIMMDPKGLISYWNPASETILGYSKEEAIGKNLHNLLVPEHYLKAHREALPEFLRTGRGNAIGKTVEMEAKRKDGREIAVALSLSAVSLNGEWHAVGILRDITDQRRAEKEKSELELQLRESQKMDAVGQLAGGISHDFNNLLTIITGYSQVLLMSPDLKENLRPQIKEILQSGERAAALTRQLLLFSRRQSVESRIIDLDAIISGMEKMLRRLIREDIIVNRKIEPSPWQIKADPGSIEQVIMNLVINASDAMPSGGALAVETENVKIGETNRLGTHSDINPGSYVMLSISDTGCGMDDKVRERIFEPFFTTKEVGKGTGLGLATVYGIVKQINGYIDVQSELGKGTTFRIYFPRTADEGVGNEKQNDAAIMPKGSETILLTEDEEKLRKMLQSFLHSIGYAVIPACNGKEALEIIEKRKGQIHLLLTDIVMPGMNGFELAKQAKDLFPEIKLLFMSGYDSKVDTDKMMKTNGNFIQKPIVLIDLSVKLREILDK
jgi:PAS domain S-box-containing protein